MEIKFRTKEEANAAQEQSFLELEPIERIYSFLELLQNIKKFPNKHISKKDSNFIIQIQSRV